MKLGILSVNPDLYSTRRLIEAAEQRGHEAKVIDYLSCSMTIASHKPELFLNGESLGDTDAVIPRIGVTQSLYGMAVVRQFEMMGVATQGSRRPWRGRSEERGRPEFRRG